MVKYGKIQLLLHRNNKNRTKIAKKKSNKTRVDKPASSLADALGFGKLLHNERLNFFIGVVLFIVSIYAALAFVSYFFTGAADQSVIDELHAGELQNQNHEFHNSCGSLGKSSMMCGVSQTVSTPICS